MPHSVRPLLRRQFFGRRWDCATQCDHWLASDGTTVVVLKISGAPAHAVSRMRSRFDDLRRKHPGLIPSHEMVRELLATIARDDQLT